MKITAENEKQHRGKMVRVRSSDLAAVWQEKELVGMHRNHGFVCWNDDKTELQHCKYCETIPEKIRKPYTAETCPDYPSLRRDNWARGVCVCPNIDGLGLWWLNFEGEEKRVTWAELAAENSPWTDRSGQPLCIVEEIEV